jgi:hypothetical protein
LIRCGGLPPCMLVSTRTTPIVLGHQRTTRRDLYHKHRPIAVSARRVSSSLKLRPSPPNCIITADCIAPASSVECACRVWRVLFTSGHAHSSLHEHDSARIGESPQNTPSTTLLLRHLTALAGLAWSRRGFLRLLLVEEDHRWKRISQASARSSTAFQAFIPQRASRLTDRTLSLSIDI